MVQTLLRLQALRCETKRVDIAVHTVWAAHYTQNLSAANACVAGMIVQEVSGSQAFRYSPHM